MKVTCLLLVSLIRMHQSADHFSTNSRWQARFEVASVGDMKRLRIAVGDIRCIQHVENGAQHAAFGDTSVNVSVLRHAVVRCNYESVFVDERL